MYDAGFLQLLRSSQLLNWVGATKPRKRWSYLESNKLSAGTR